MKRLITYLLLLFLAFVPVTSAKFIMPVQGGGGECVCSTTYNDCNSGGGSDEQIRGTAYVPGSTFTSGGSDSGKSLCAIKINITTNNQASGSQTLTLYVDDDSSIGDTSYTGTYILPATATGEITIELGTEMPLSNSTSYWWGVESNNTLFADRCYAEAASSNVCSSLSEYTCLWQSGVNAAPTDLTSRDITAELVICNP